MSTALAHKSVSSSLVKAPSTLLYTRQRALLSLLESLGGVELDADFQTLLFLYCETPNSGRPYEFVPTANGIHSPTAQADRQKLIDRGLLEDIKGPWKISAAGRRAIARESKAPAALFAKRHIGIRGSKLLTSAYSQHPYFSGDSLVSVKKGQVASAQVRTIGYEGVSVENYLNKLLVDGVTLLCDVRRNPLSRKFGFSKGALSRCCSLVGIRYEHMPELGIGSDKRRSLESQADYDALFVEYCKESLPNQTAALLKIKGWIDSGERVALTCFEHLPHQCHRHCVADEMARTFGEDFSPIHL